jgi:hypothetical protein
MPRSARSSPMARASGTDRASWSSLGTTSVSPARTAARAWSRPGRFRLAPVSPWSRYTRSSATPSSRSRSRCAVRSWASVEQRALALLSCRVAPERSGERTYGAVPSTCLLLAAALQCTRYGPSARSHVRNYCGHRNDTRPSRGAAADSVAPGETRHERHRTSHARLSGVADQGLTHDRERTDNPRHPRFSSDGVSATPLVQAATGRRTGAWCPVGDPLTDACPKIILSASGCPQVPQPRY